MREEADGWSVLLYGGRWRRWTKRTADVADDGGGGFGLGGVAAWRGNEESKASALTQDKPFVFRSHDANTTLVHHKIQRRWKFSLHLFHHHLLSIPSYSLNTLFICSNLECSPRSPVSLISSAQRPDRHLQPGTQTLFPVDVPFCVCGRSMPLIIHVRSPIDFLGVTNTFKGATLL